jgi:hypothetical protein
MFKSQYDTFLVVDHSRECFNILGKSKGKGKGKGKVKVIPAL